MKILTWNINSVRLRINLLSELIAKENPDIIALQETKVENLSFPVEIFRNMGFEGVYFNGEKSYNGVAILSKKKLTNVFSLELVNKQARHIAANIDGKFELHNFYIPAGGDEPDIDINPKFLHKLQYCQEMKDWFLANRTKHEHIMLLGDLNIAPYENDVWSHKQLLKVVSHTEVEVNALLEIYNCLDFEDHIRKQIPMSEKAYSWWSYRNRDWKKSNRGRRLDHIWSTKKLSEKIIESYMLKEIRDWPKPSDHVPVVTVISEE